MKSLIIALFLLLTVTVGSAEELCTGPGCQRTASLVDWPGVVESGGFEVVFRQFSLTLPDSARRVATSGDMLFVACRNDSDFVFDLITAEDYATSAFPHGIHVGSRYSLADMARLPFLQPADASAPEPEADQRVWQDAMRFKGDVFGQDNPVLRIAQGDLEVFLYRSPAEPFGNYALLFDLHQSDAYVHLSAKGMSFDEFKKVLGSLKLR